jgi:hypothetical protein
LPLLNTVIPKSPTVLLDVEPTVPVHSSLRKSGNWRS